VTKLLERAVETVRGLPPETQDDLARVLLQLAGEDQPVVELTPEEAASFDESLAQTERREFATDEQVRAIWSKHGLPFDVKAWFGKLDEYLDEQFMRDGRQLPPMPPAPKIFDE